MGRRVWLGLAVVATVAAFGACAGAGSGASERRAAAITGEVRRVDNGELLGEVTIVATCPCVSGWPQTVARDGRFTLSGLPAGTYDVRAYWGSSGYRVGVLDLAPGETRSLAITIDTDATESGHHGYP